MNLNSLFAVSALESGIFQRDIMGIIQAFASWRMRCILHLGMAEKPPFAPFIAFLTLAEGYAVQGKPATLARLSEAGEVFFI
jgi:hypothetical protein